MLSLYYIRGYENACDKPCVSLKTILPTAAKLAQYSIELVQDEQNSLGEGESLTASALYNNISDQIVAKLMCLTGLPRTDASNLVSNVHEVLSEAEPPAFSYFKEVIQPLTSVVNTQISASAYTKILDEIKNQIHNIEQGEISTEQFEMIISQAFDSVRNDGEYTQELLKIPLDEFIPLLKNVLMLGAMDGNDLVSIVDLQVDVINKILTTLAQFIS